MTPDLVWCLVAAGLGVALLRALFALWTAEDEARRERSAPHRHRSVCGGDVWVFEDGTTLLLRAGEVYALHVPRPPAPVYDDGGY